MHQEKATLQRQLKPMHVWAVAFGCIVGWGSFINPGKSFSRTPASPERPSPWRSARWS